MLTDHTKRSYVLEDVLIKMSLHSSFLPIFYETSWNRNKKKMHIPHSGKL